MILEKKRGKIKISDYSEAEREQKRTFAYNFAVIENENKEVLAKECVNTS